MIALISLPSRQFTSCRVPGHCSNEFVRGHDTGFRLLTGLHYHHESHCCISLRICFSTNKSNGGRSNRHSIKEHFILSVCSWTDVLEHKRQSELLDHTKSVQISVTRI